jgi:hypothetical protein
MDYKNIVETRKLNNKLGSLGRNGDSEIRYVDGKPSHVNPLEASLIDSYGKSGEKFVKEIGAGTTNPYTGLKEYVPAGGSDFEGFGGGEELDFDQIESWSQGGDPDSFREFMDEFGFPNTDGGIHIYETYAKYLTPVDVSTEKSFAEAKKLSEDTHLGYDYSRIELKEDAAADARAAALDAYDAADIKEEQLGQQMGRQARTIGDTSRAAMGKSGLATSGTIQSQMQDQMGDLFSGARTAQSQRALELQGLHRGVAAADRTQDELDIELDEWNQRSLDVGQQYTEDIYNIEKQASDDFIADVVQAMQAYRQSSDIRLKENIKYIGKSSEGFKIYEFNYKDKEGRYRGVMADDIPFHPAVSRGDDGYYEVDYSQIDVNFERIK